MEDKIVKHFFNFYSQFKKNPSRYLPIKENKSSLFKFFSKKPLTPDSKELQENIRSRSAKLRYGVKNKNSNFNHEEFIKKFEKYFNLEGIRV